MLQDYDLAECRKFLMGVLTNAGMMLFFHLQLKAVIPLYFQGACQGFFCSLFLSSRRPLVFMGLFRIWDWEQFRLHVWGETAEQFPKLARPFPVPPNPMASMLSGFFGNTDEPEQEQQAANASPNAPVIDPSEPRVEIVDDDEE